MLQASIAPTSFLYINAIINCLNTILTHQEKKDKSNERKTKKPLAIEMLRSGQRKALASQHDLIHGMQITPATAKITSEINPTIK
jgi:hypothetical protein